MIHEGLDRNRTPPFRDAWGELIHAGSLSPLTEHHRVQGPGNTGMTALASMSLGGPTLPATARLISPVVFLHQGN